MQERICIGLVPAVMLFSGLCFAAEEDPVAWWKFDEEIPDYDPYFVGGRGKTINPAFIINGWGKSSVSLKINGKTISPGKNFRTGYTGYEKPEAGTDLIIWLKLESQGPMDFSIYTATEQTRIDCASIVRTIERKRFE